MVSLDPGLRDPGARLFRVLFGQGACLSRYLFPSLSKKKEIEQLDTCDGKHIQHTEDKQNPKPLYAQEDLVQHYHHLHKVGGKYLQEVHGYIICMS